ncbi:hypothetical protein [Solicola sp. PLA-1-18]|uniref:hypothetical protein n=1 Tax=Solicola sp. PLA-1-18 TaxID=3380532 RepID=UPI003B7694A7
MTKWLLDGQPIDLYESGLEGWIHDGDEVALTFIVPAQDSPVPGIPLRLTLRLGGSSAVTEVGRWATDDCSPTMQVDGLYWLEGTFAARAWVLRSNGLGGPSETRWELLVDHPTTIIASVEELNPARPPYLLLMPEVFTDGVWDLATADATITTDVDLDDLDLSADLKKRIRVWNGAWESAAHPHHRPDLEIETRQIAAAIKQQMPDTTVCY